MTTTTTTCTLFDEEALVLVLPLMTTTLPPSVSPSPPCVNRWVFDFYDLVLLGFVKEEVGESLHISKQAEVRCEDKEGSQCNGEGGYMGGRKRKILPSSYSSSSSRSKAMKNLNSPPPSSSSLPLQAWMLGCSLGMSGVGGIIAGFLADKVGKVRQTESAMGGGQW